MTWSEMERQSKVKPGNGDQKSGGKGSVNVCGGAGTTWGGKKMESLWE